MMRRNPIEVPVSPRPVDGRQRCRVRAAVWLALALILASVLGLLPAGCGSSEPENSLPDPMATHERQGDASLQQALNFVNRLDEFEQSAAHSEILNNLQEWFSEQTLDANWEPDPLTQTLPDRYLSMVARERLAQAQLEPYDAIVLQEATWMRDVARSVARPHTASPWMEKLLSEVAADHEPGTAAELSLAAQLFDWTVRNLQLDADVESGGKSRFESDVILYAWESLLFGRGTLAEKSRVFILLCRQADISAVMLGVAPAQAAGGDLKLWLPAVIVGGQLYLFDMRLGTPVPGPDGRGIASLEQVLENPALLEPLALPEHAYPVSAEELSRLVVLIDATPPELSQRMQHLEQALVGDQKLVLTASPSRIAHEISESLGDSEIGVGIWPLPYEGFLARVRLEQNPQGIVQLIREHSLFDRQTPLVRARILHLRGQYENQVDRQGAQALYLECRTSESDIESVANLPMPVREGEEQTAPDPQRQTEHRRRLQALQTIMRRTKEYATYWLGLLAYERGNYGVAINYIENLLLSNSPNTQWLAGATYNLARAYEARGQATGQADDLRRAVELYASLTGTPQAAAGQWRARQLNNLESSQPADESE